MNRNRLFILIVVVGGFIYWWSRPVAPPRVEAPPAPKPRASVKPPPPPVAAKPAPAPTPLPEPKRPRPATTASATHRPPEGAVPFRVQKGFVIAYGDILLGKVPHAEYPNTGIVDIPELHLWTNAVIPFVIHPQLPNPERILQAFKYLQENTPIRFVQFSGEPDAIVFMPFEDACLSYLGRTGGNQPIYLDAKCGTQEILHEIMHALGFIHEHSRTDRDRYVAVDWRNVQPDKEEQFWLTPATWNEALLQRPFDFQSIMLYPPEAFAKDRAKPTLYSRGEAIAPTKTGLSAEDLERLRTLYGGR